MPVQWENKEIAMANIFTLVGKLLLFFFVLIEVHRLDFVENPKGKKKAELNCLILSIDRMSIMILHFTMLHCLP